MKNFKHTLNDYIRDAGKLGQALSINPRNLDTVALARGIWHATHPERREHMPLTQAARAISGQIRTVLPAYRTEDAVGPGLPVMDGDRDGTHDHLPAVIGGDTLPAAVSWNVWRNYVHSLAGWISDHLKVEPGTYRVEEAALDLHLAAPDLELSRATPRLLAGRFGMEDMAAILDEYYSPGTAGRRWIPELEGLEDEDDGDEWADDDLWDDFDAGTDDDEDDEVTELLEVITDLQARLDAATAALAGHTNDDNNNEDTPSAWENAWGPGFEVHAGLGGPQR